MVYYNIVLYIAMLCFIVLYVTICCHDILYLIMTCHDHTHLLTLLVMSNVMQLIVLYNTYHIIYLGIEFRRIIILVYKIF